MTDTQRPWDRLTPDSDPAYEAFAAYLDTGSLRDAYRQRSISTRAIAHRWRSTTLPLGGRATSPPGRRPTTGSGS